MTTDTTALRRFLEIPYDELEELNLGTKHQRIDDEESASQDRQRKSSFFICGQAR